MKESKKKFRSTTRGAVKMRATFTGDHSGQHNSKPILWSINVYPRPEALVDDIEVHPCSEVEEIEVPISINKGGKASVTGNVSKDKFIKIVKCLQDGG